MSRNRVERTVRSDVLIVGSGVAGLMAALDSAPLSVALLTKRAFGRASSSWLAQGGIAVAWDPEDSPRLHADDTLAVGGGLSNLEAVETITREGPALVSRLIDLGVRFDADPSGRLRLGREAAHSRSRVVHANGDATGAAVVEALTEAVRHTPSVRLFEDCQALDLLLEDGRVIGVLARSQHGEVVAHLAAATILATGGIGGIYLWTTNPVESTGDGLAMAARAGARLVDLEFEQFHPTALAVDTSPVPLLTEAIRGEGATLIDSSGHRFMPDDHPEAELAPRDVVARSIWARKRKGVEVFLDARRAIGDRFPSRFPTVYRLCLEHGLDPRRDPIPVTPAAHYHIGGIAADAVGRSSLEGLWVCGETAATGVHGANRLASNSLLEAMVFGHRVSTDVKNQWKPRKIQARSALGAVMNLEGRRQDAVRRTVRALMWSKVGLLRDAVGLRAALDALTGMELGRTVGLGETRNMITVGRLVAFAALAREESRGVHFRTDFPESRPEWDRHLSLTDPLLGLPEEALAEAK